MSENDTSDDHDWRTVRKKPVEVEARGPYDDPTVVETLEGDFEVDEDYAAQGFYIVRGVEGEEYPCRSDIFHDTYETGPETEPEIETPNATGAPVTLSLIEKLIDRHPAWRATSHTTRAGREVTMIEYADDQYEFTAGLPGAFVSFVDQILDSEREGDDGQ